MADDADRQGGATVFVFPGHATRWAGAAAELENAGSAFFLEMQRCDAAFAEFVDWSLFDVVRGDAAELSLDRIDVGAPALFAVMVSLAAQWRALGIEPQAVLGHSQGELAAAYVAGALSLRDAAKVVVLGSRAVSAMARPGGVISIAQPLNRVLAVIEPWAQSVSIWAQNDLSSTVVTGHEKVLADLATRCRREGLSINTIPLDHAAHVDQVDKLWEALREALVGVQPRTCRVAFISAVTGAGLDPSILDGDYWLANLRQSALFDDAVRWSYEHGYHTFIESSPQPALSGEVRQALRNYRGPYTVVDTVCGDDEDLRRMHCLAAELKVVEGRCESE